LSVAAPTGISSFTYDGDGNRITQATPSGTYDYVNDTAVALPVLLAENGPDGAIDYAYGLGLTESSSLAFNYFYNVDALGSISNLTDSTGTVKETYSYDAWGNALSASGKVGTQNKFRFTGQALDPATGLYFLRARYYDPGSGRFLGKDTFPGNASIPITLNHYIYAANEPLKFIDPSGFYALPYGGPPTSSVPWWTCANRPCQEYGGNWVPLEPEQTPEEELEQARDEALANAGVPEEGNWAQVAISLLNLGEIIAPPSTCLAAHPQWPPQPPSPLPMPPGPFIAPAPAPLPPPIPEGPSIAPAPTVPQL